MKTGRLDLRVCSASSTLPMPDRAMASWQMQGTLSGSFFRPFSAALLAAVKLELRFMLRAVRKEA